MKTIALIDFSLEGHHLSFMRTFSKILLQQRNRVICIVPETDKVKGWIEEQAPEHKHNFFSHPYTYTPIEPTRWDRFNETVKVLHRWKKEAEAIATAEKKFNLKIDLVFYGWLDNQLAPYIPSFVLNLVFPYKWSGLYFHPYHLRNTDKFLKRKAVWRDHDAVFLSTNCTSVTVHDLGIVQQFSKRINKPVTHFPETADDTPPDYNYFLYDKIKQAAKGRIVVGMIGCEKHKGTLTMKRMAKLADAGKFFFAFLGILPESTFSKDEWQEVREFINVAPENCFFHFQSIPEGSAYNAVFCAIDIPFLVYDHFISSSNRLTKAAIFQKLVLASDNFCVGEDVKKFHLGAAVTPQNPEAALQGLEQLAEQIERNKYPTEEWEAYKKLNSYEMLYQRFGEVLACFN
jgi:hypothetical protein